ncbi:MAG: LuxR C-terminal-related transcriptional regulator, partial [Gemmatimonadales bacterium]
PLTPRELEVLRLAGYDTPVAVIARRTHLSPGTVRNYVAAAASTPRNTVRYPAPR